MGTVLWDIYQGKVIVDLESRMEANVAAIGLLKNAETVGEVHDADLPGWAETIVQATVQNREFDGEDVGSDSPWIRDEDSPHAVTSMQLLRQVPLPHTARAVEQWLSRDFLREYAEVGGASPGGNVDVYDVHDKDEFFEALREAGHNVERSEGLWKRYDEALSS